MPGASSNARPNADATHTGQCSSQTGKPTIASVANSATRSRQKSPVAANAFASLNKLAPGRIDFGVGTGFTGRRAMGLGAVKLADMEEYVRTVMALLREETAEGRNGWFEANERLGQPATADDFSKDTLRRRKSLIHMVL